MRPETAARLVPGLILCLKHQEDGHAGAGLLLSFVQVTSSTVTIASMAERSSARRRAGHSLVAKAVVSTATAD
jgi:hypothetical protein